MAALLRHYFKTAPLPTLGASLAPDLVDKGLYHGLGITNSSRTLGHTLLGAAVSTIVIYLTWGKSAARSWFIGYLGHLVADADGFVPWCYPWKEYTFHASLRQRQREWLRQFFRPSLIELLLILWAVLVSDAIKKS